MRQVFDLNKVDMGKIDGCIKQLPNVAEDTINEYLHTKGVQHGIDYIKSEMPRGLRNKKTSKGQPRTHAKESDSLGYETNFNLGFVIKTRSQFNYLVFPEYGRGNSYKHQPNDFMGRGLNKAVENKIIPELEEILVKKMEEKI
jgi:hypothetical protein